MTTKNKISKIFARYIIDVNTNTYEDGWRESQIVLNIQKRLKIKRKMVQREYQTHRTIKNDLTTST